MGRKPISPKTRSIPVSFSVKPYLADKIENLAYDQRFTRSKFLQEAVLRYINFIEMKDSPMLHDMSAEQRIVIGANALQEANRDGDEIRPSIIEHLRKQLRLFDASQELEKEAPTKLDAEARKVRFEVRKHNAGHYHVYDLLNENKVYTITKLTNPKIIQGGLKWKTEHLASKDYGHHKTLKLAVEAVMEGWI
jgi:hypothetical protein